MDFIFLKFVKLSFSVLGSTKLVSGATPHLYNIFFLNADFRFHKTKQSENKKINGVILMTRSA